MTPKQVSLDQIDRIAFWHGVGVMDVLSRDRRRVPTEARRDCAQYFRGKGKSFTEIGNILGRDHTSILYLVYGKEWKARTRPVGLPKRAGYTAGLI